MTKTVLDELIESQFQNKKLVAAKAMLQRKVEELEGTVEKLVYAAVADRQKVERLHKYHDLQFKNCARAHELVMRSMHHVHAGEPVKAESELRLAIDVLGTPTRVPPGGDSDG